MVTLWKWFLVDGVDIIVGGVVVTKKRKNSYMHHLGRTMYVLLQNSRDKPTEIVQGFVYTRSG